MTDVPKEIFINSSEAKRGFGKFSSEGIIEYPMRWPHKYTRTDIHTQALALIETMKEAISRAMTREMNMTSAEELDKAYSAYRAFMDGGKG